jgi:diaminohydroxyphosphoribosylaminopyrimidine deaminase/5-amino-6-(5-phosphoribosylamino)uracil reductase
MALASGIVDKVLLYYAPKILGAGSVPFAGGGNFSRLNAALHVKHSRLHRFGEDFAVEGYLRNPYEE